MKNIAAQLAGAVEYANCFSAEGQDPTSNECPDMTLNCIWWGGSSFGECRVLFHCHYFQVHLEW